MRPELKSSFIQASSKKYGDFIDYINYEDAIESCEMNPENYKFWLDCIGATLEDNPITEDIVDYIRDINNKLFPSK